MNRTVGDYGPTIISRKICSIIRSHWKNINSFLGLRYIYFIGYFLFHYQNLFTSMENKFIFHEPMQVCMCTSKANRPIIMGESNDHKPPGGEENFHLNSIGDNIPLSLSLCRNVDILDIGLIIHKRESKNIFFSKGEKTKYRDVKPFTFWFQFDWEGNRIEINASLWTRTIFWNMNNFSLDGGIRLRILLSTS